MNSFVTIKDITFIILKLSKKKHPGPHPGSTGEFYQMFKNWVPGLPNLIQKTEEEGILPNSSYEANFTLAPKRDKDYF